MKRIKAQQQLAELLSSANNLIALGQLEGAYLTVKHALPHAIQVDAVAQLLGHVQQLPLTTRRLPAWAELEVRLAGAANEPRILLAIIDDLNSDSRNRLAAYTAWAMVRLRRYAEVIELTAHMDESTLEPGLSWRSRGEALAHLGHPEWRAAFARARTHLRGVPLGLCLREEGGLCALKGDFLTARQLLAEAFACLQNNPFEAVWTKYNQGIVSLNVLLPEAESHFLEMQALLRSPASRRFEARAWCGLGASRRALGEFERAISAYRRACRVAEKFTDTDDCCQAWLGLGQTRRVEGLLIAALEAFHTAARFDPLARDGSSFVVTFIAAVQVQLGDFAGAQRSLALSKQASGGSREHRERWAVVKAELHRVRGEASEAIAILHGLTFETLWMREERLCFPQLFALLEAVGGQGPEVLVSATGFVVDVRAAGSLRVLVNQRSVVLTPTGMAGQVLVLLLERGGQASVSALIAALFPNVLGTMERAKAKQLSRHIADLRDALGWVESVKAIGGAYRLDERAVWQYDIRVARVHGAAIPRFLDGVYAEWAIEVGRSLSDTKRLIH